MKSIYKVAIIGGGTMGADLAALMARQDMPVVVKELNDDLAQRFKERFDQRVDGWLEKGKINDSRADQLKMLCAATSSLNGLAGIDLVIEAVPENLGLKQSLLSELSEILPQAILTSNTSSLPILLLSLKVKNPERMAGMHFFNPPTKMPLVELISSTITSPTTIESLELFATETLGKKPIRVKDRPGFLVNVLLGAYLAPAIRALEEADVRLEAIDQEARSFGWPMGPFTLLDMMGVDLADEVMNILFNAYGKRFAPSVLVKHLVSIGRLGHKKGAGFYGGIESLAAILKREFPARVEGNSRKIFEKMMCGMVNEAAIALQDNVASANDIETGCLFGLGFPQGKGGILHYADEIGLPGIVDVLNAGTCELLRKMDENGETFFDTL